MENEYGANLLSTSFTMLPASEGKLWVVANLSGFTPSFMVEKKITARFFDGDSWQTTIDVDSNTVNPRLRYDATVDSSDRLHVINSYDTGVDINIFSFDTDGQAYAPTTLLQANDAVGTATDNPSIAVAQNGDILAAWAQNINSLYEDDLVGRRFNGSSWEPVEFLENTVENVKWGADTSKFIVENSGHLFLIWRVENADSNEEIMVSKYNGSSWGSAVHIDTIEHNAGNLFVHKSGSADFIQIRSGDSSKDVSYKSFDGSAWGNYLPLLSTPLDHTINKGSFIQYSDFGQKLFIWHSDDGQEKNVRVKSYD